MDNAMFAVNDFVVFPGVGFAYPSTPKSVEADEAVRDTTTFAIGPRFHFKLSDSVWFRPGVALALPLDKPMTKSDYKVVQLDLPLAF